MLRSEQTIQQLIDYMTLENKSPCTIENYVESVTRFVAWSKANNRDNIALYVQDWVLYLKWVKKLAPSSINLHSSAVRYYCNFILKKPVSKDVVPRMKEPSKLPDPLSFEEVSKVFSVVNNRKHLLLLQVTYYGGLRLSDVRNLRVRNIRFDTGVIHIESGKGYKDRYVMLPDKIKEPLKEHIQGLKSDDLVFTSQQSGGTYPKRTIERIFENACVKAQIPGKHNIHRLRHTYGAHMVKKGVNLRVIQQTLGHRSPTTTMIYTKVACEDIQNLRNVLTGNGE